MVKNAVAIGSSGDLGTHTAASATDAIFIGTATVASGEAATAIGKKQLRVKQMLLPQSVMVQMQVKIIQLQWVQMLQLPIHIL